MKITAKKALSLVLALLMAFGMAPGTALGAITEDYVPEAEPAAEAIETPADETEPPAASDELAADEELSDEELPDEEEQATRKLSLMSLPTGPAITKVTYELDAEASGRSAEDFEGVYVYGDVLKAVLTEDSEDVGYVTSYKWLCVDTKTNTEAGTVIDGATESSFTIADTATVSLLGKYIYLEVTQTKASSGEVNTYGYVGDYVVKRDLANTAITGTADSSSVDYDGAEHEIDFSGVQIATGGANLTEDDYEFSHYVKLVTVNGVTTEEAISGKPVNAGTYKAVLKGKGNYAGTITLDTKLNIKPREISIKAADQTISYGGSIAEYSDQDAPANAKATITAGDLIGTHRLSSLKLTQVGDTVAAGGYIMPSDAKISYEDTAAATPVDVSANYDISYITGTLTIQKANLSESFAVTMGDWTYGDTAAEPEIANCPSEVTVTYSYYTDEACTAKTTVADHGAAAAGDKPSYPGTYWIKADATSDNYNPASRKDDFTISKREIKIQAGSDEKTYDGTALTADDFSFAEKTPATEESAAVLYTLAEGDSVKEIEIVGTQTNAGSSNNVITPDSIKIVHTEGSVETDVTACYNISELIDGTLTVNTDSGMEGNIPDDVTIDFHINPARYYYYGIEYKPVPEVLFKGSPLVEGTDYTVEYSEDCVNAGEKDVTVTLMGNFEGSKSAKFYIEKRTVYISAINQTVIYDEDTPSFVLNAEGALDSIYTITNGDLAAVDKISGELGCVDANGNTVQKGTDIGTYAITLGTLRIGNENYQENHYDNYNIIFTPASLTIKPADTLSFDVESYVGTYDGQAHGVTLKDFAIKTTAYTADDFTISYRTAPVDALVVTDEGSSFDESKWSEWTTEAPTLTDAGACYVQVKLSKANYVDKLSETEGILIAKADLTASVSVSNPITVEYEGGSTTVDLKSVIYGESADDKFVISYTGFVDGESVETEGLELVAPTIYCEYDVEVPAKRIAGEYEVSLSGGSAKNYNITTDENSSCKLTVKPKAITITGIDRSWVYDGTEHWATEDDENGETVQGYELEGELAYEDFISMTAFSGSVRYYAEEPTANEPSEFTIMSHNYPGEDVDVSESYHITYEKGELTITKRPLTLTWGYVSFDYNGQWQLPELTVGNIVERDLIGYDVATQQIDANTYTAEASLISLDSAGTDLNNYSWDEEDLTVKFTINKVASSMNGATVKAIAGLSYNALAQDLVKLTGTPLGGTVYYAAVEADAAAPEDEDYSTEIPAMTNAGSYDVYWKLVGDNNHFDGETGTIENIKIEKADLTMTPKNTTISYGTAIGASTLGTIDQRLFELSYVGLKGNDASTIPPDVALQDYIDCDYVANDPEKGNVGNYVIAINAERLDAVARYISNYSFICGSGTLTVSKVPAVLTAPAAKTGLKVDLTGASQYLTTQGSVIGGTLQYKLDEGEWTTDVPTAVYAGTYTVYYKVIPDGNHTWDEADNGSIEVTISKHDYAASDFSVQRGNAVYDGLAKAAEISGASGKNVGNISVSYFSQSGLQLDGAPSAAGKYTFRISVDETPYYNEVANLTDASWAFEITKAVLTASVQSKTISYGADAPSSYSLEYAGFVNGEGTDVLDTTELRFSCDYNKSDASKRGVGSYTVSASGVSAANYAITFVNGSLTVTKAELTVTASPSLGEITYGDDAPAYSLSYVGFVNGEDASVITTVPTITSDYDKSDASKRGVGTYRVKASGGEAANYSFKYVDEAFSVVKAAAVVTANNAEKVYGDNDPALSASVSGLKYDGDSVAYTLARIEGEDAGTYAITPSGAVDQGNYSVSFALGTFTIKPREISLTMTSFEKTYGEADPTLSYSVTSGSFVNGATLASLGYTISRAEGENVGTYDITATKPSTGVKNYNITVTKGTLTIKPKAVEVTVTPGQFKEYGDADPAKFDTAVGGLIEGDEIAYTAMRAEGEEPGNYTITTAGEANQGNYTVTYNTGTFTIIKKSIADEPRRITVAIERGATALKYNVGGLLPEETDGFTANIASAGFTAEAALNGTSLEATFAALTAGGAEKTITLSNIETTHYSASDIIFALSVVGSDGSSSSVNDETDAAADESFEGVKGLDNIASDEAASEKQAAENGTSVSVNVSVHVEKTENPDGVATYLAGHNDEEPVSFDITLDKTVTTTKDGVTSSESEPITVASRVLEIALSYDPAKGTPLIAREHDGSQVQFTRLSRRPEGTAADPYKDGTYYVDAANSTVYVYSRYFSVFTIGYTNNYTVIYEINYTLTGDALANYLPHSQQFTAGEAGNLNTVAEIGYTRTGYTFSRWTTNANGTGSSFTNGQSVTFDAAAAAPLNADMVLYAQWTSNNSGGGGGGGGSSSGGSSSGGSSSGGSSTVVVDTGSSTGSETTETTETTEGETNTEETKQVADPAETGVSEWLITDEHPAFMSGYKNGSFKPSGYVTRAEVATMFYRLLTEEKKAAIDPSKYLSFPDVTENEWFYEPVSALSSLGILSGRKSGKFLPKNYISRAEFAALAVRFANISEGKPSFSDVRDGFWAENEIAAASSFGWVEGYSDGSFRPFGNITRAEAATIINRMLGRSADKTYVDAHIGDGSLKSYSDIGSSSEWYFYEVIEASNAHEFEKTESGESWK